MTARSRAAKPRGAGRAPRAAVAGAEAAPAGVGGDPLLESPQLADRLSFMVHELGARIAAVGNRHFREHGLNHFSARILVLLLEQGELRTGELVERMVLPQSTISSQLLALHKRKLIRRRRSRQDNRSVMVSLTPAGAEVARDCNELSIRVQRALLADVDPRERDIALDFLRKVRQRLTDLEQQELFPFHPLEQVQRLADDAPSSAGG